MPRSIGARELHESMSANGPSPLFTGNRVSGKYGGLMDVWAPSGHFIFERMLMCDYLPGLAGSAQQLLDFHQCFKNRKGIPQLCQVLSPRRSLCAGHSNSPSSPIIAFAVVQYLLSSDTATQKRRTCFPSGQMSFKQTTAK